VNSDANLGGVEADLTQDQDQGLEAKVDPDRKADHVNGGDTKAEAQREEKDHEVEVHLADAPEAIHGKEEEREETQVEAEAEAEAEAE